MNPISPLNRPDEYYRQTGEILESAIRNSAFYLHKMTGDDLSTCRSAVVKYIGPDGVFKVRDPVVNYTVRDPNTGDRHEDTTTLRQYLNMVKQEDLIIVPTLTAYLPKKEKVSFIGKDIIINMKRRSAFKDKKFEATRNKDKLGESIYEALQSSAKYLNNSLSGLMSIATTALFNRSAHPTLTSTCRNATSYANMHNEQFISGNRPYFSPSDVIEHATAVCNMADMNAVVLACNEHALHLPSADEAMECANKSLMKYSYPTSSVRARMLKYFQSLSPHQRAAFVYNDDLFHLAKHNKDFVFNLLSNMCKVPETVPGDAHKDCFSKSDSDTKTSILFQNGFFVKSRGKNSEKNDPEVVDLLDRHAWHLDKVLRSTQSVFNAFWLTRIQPANHAYMDLVRRQSVPVSDTDSTIFTTQEWTKFITGSYNFDELSYRVGNATTLLTAKIVGHWLKQMTTNSNVDKKDISLVSMKNEFYYPIIALTSVAKHYAGLRWGQEGIVLPELTPEIKGVGLRSSAWPEQVKKDVSEFIVSTLTKIVNGETLSRDEIFSIPLKTESGLIDQLSSATSELYSIVPVKPASGYARPMSSAYAHYVYWQEMFASKYGDTPEPPYTGIKVPINVPSPTAIKTFIAGIKDRNIADKIEQSLKTNNKRDITNLILPHSVVVSTGIPEELMPVIDRNTMLSNVNGAYYMILNAFGFFIRDKEKSICIYDLYQESKEVA